MTGGNAAGERLTMQNDLPTRRAAYAVENADNLLNVVRLSLMRALEEVGKYQRSFTDEADLSRKADVLNWTINYLITGILPNLRIDLLATSKASLKTIASIPNNA
jgi:hypothetical protein